MALPAFDGGWRGGERTRPHIRVLEVRDRATPDEAPIAWLFVQRQEAYKRDPRLCDGEVFEASITLSFETVESSHSCRRRVGGSFSATYSRGFCGDVDSVSLVNSALFLDPLELRGQRIGTYLMSEIVAWAQQWPEAEVRSVELLSGQAGKENRARRNRFYERYGLVFDYRDAEHCEGRSKPMRVKELVPVASWEQNIRERDVRDYLAETLSERDRLERHLSQRDAAVKSLSETVAEARDAPVRWVARLLWWRYSRVLIKGAVLVALGALAWLRLGSK